MTFTRRIIYALVCLAWCLPALGAHDAAADTVPSRRASAWTLAGPLGERRAAAVDTLPGGYQRQAVPSMVSDAYVTTGNLGAEGQDQVFFSRRERGPFFFLDALEAWLPSAGRQKFYNVYAPLTQVSYSGGGGKQNSQERLRVDFAGNVNRRTGLGAKLDYIYSKGSYACQATKDFVFGFSGYHKGDRYELQAFYNHWNLLNKENGGITDPLYVTDPAQLQGGVSRIDAKSIPVRLNAAHSRVNGQQLYVNQAWNVGYWREEQVNDTLARRVYVPVTKFVWTLDFESGHHIFLNDNAAEGDAFWADRYLQPQQTRDDTRYHGLTNTLGVSMVEGFSRWARFSLSAYAQYAWRQFRQPGALIPGGDDFAADALTPLPEGFAVKARGTQHLLWAGAQLAKRRGSILTYAADFRMGLAGDVAADLELEGRVGTRIPLLGDTAGVDAEARFRNVAQPYLLQHYVSNHFAWDNDFGKTRSFRAGGAVTLPWTRTRLEAGFENLQNLVYFDASGRPAQHGGSVQVFAARLNQELRLGILHWDNTLTLQTVSRADVLPLPLLALYSDLYLHFRAFRVLDVRLGVDCDYYTRYHAPAYQPATMSFHVQDEVKTGNYPFMNLYASCRLYKTRFFVMVSHVNQGWFSRDCFSAPLYPLNPRKFQFGLSVDFVN